MGKYKKDYRAWARKHFIDHYKALPAVAGATKMHGKTYIYDSVSKTQEKTYETKWKCPCSKIEIRDFILHKILLTLEKKLFVACPRCSCFMTFVGLEENLFTKVYIYSKCLFLILKKSWENRFKKTV